jgi:DNA-binding NarL/FixJ family response regulator
MHADPSRVAAEGDELDADEMVILDMLSRGTHVERIASAIGVHTRTVNRRLDELKRRAGVTTLFQLGAYAARHWVN